MEIDAGTAKRLFFSMLRIRIIEERIADLYPRGEMRCPVHLCTGQEAVAAGVCGALTPEDYALSGHRSHGHYLAKGGDLRSMMAELFGKATGCCAGRSGSMHLIVPSEGVLASVPILSSTIPIAAGVAFASGLLGQSSRVTVIFLGDAATEEGAFHETLNFAALKRLPIIFVCENNLYSVYTRIDDRQPAGRSVTELARAHAMPAEHGDGNDVLEVFRLAGVGIERARRGEGPTLLEFDTYRWREHCGPSFDNHLGYRTEKEFLEWKKRCPIERMEQWLLERRWTSKVEIDAEVGRIEKEFAEAVDFARNSPFPDPETLLQHVYAE